MKKCCILEFETCRLKFGADPVASHPSMNPLATRTSMVLRGLHFELLQAGSQALYWRGILELELRYIQDICVPMFSFPHQLVEVPATAGTNLAWYDSY